MALKDTLTKIREQERLEKEKLENKPQVIAEWKEATTSLMKELRDYLAEYEKDGSLLFSDDSVRLTEERLGSYSVPAMRLTVGPIVILIQPVGRLIIGAFGRVDLHRHGRAGQNQRVMLVRLPKSKTDAALIWHVVMPEAAANRGGRLPPRKQFIPLTKETLEQAIEFLLS